MTATATSSPNAAIYTFLGYHTPGFTRGSLGQDTRHKAHGDMEVLQFLMEPPLLSINFSLYLKVVVLNWGDYAPQGTLNITHLIVIDGERGANGILWAEARVPLNTL